MHENYFSTLSNYARSVERAQELYDMKQKLDIFDSHSGYAEDPKLDQLRQKAKHAVEDLYDALVIYNREETKRLYGKLDKSDSDEVINWDNLFKKLGHR